MDLTTASYSNSLFALIVVSFALQVPVLKPMTLGSVAAAERSVEDAEKGKVSEAEFQSYVNARARADEITAFWAESIKRSNSPDVLRGVRQNEIEIAVGLEGLSLDRYREIEVLVEKSADLRRTAEMLARE